MKSEIRNYKFDAHSSVPVQIPIGISLEENEMIIPYYDKKEDAYKTYMSYVGKILKILEAIVSESFIEE